MCHPRQPALGYQVFVCLRPGLLRLRTVCRAAIVIRQWQLGNREDHVTLAKFTDSYNAEVYVNPDLVTFIRQFSNDMTTINFAEEHTVTVKMQVAAVASALFNAGKPCALPNSLGGE